MGRQQAQALSLYPGSSQPLVWLWPRRLPHFVICLPVSSGKVWLNPGSWEMREILVAASSCLSGSGILGQAVP